MDKIILMNEEIAVTIHPVGAEMKSIKSQKASLEYLWQGKSHWKRSAPYLFPFVGRLKENQYTVDGQRYEMGQHGFARDSRFEIICHEMDSATLQLQSNEQTLKIYPFEFILTIHYQLTKNKVLVNVDVHNPSDREMLYNFGTHTAFNLPLEYDRNYSDYRIIFENPESDDRVLISDKGTFKRSPIKEDLHQTKELPVSKELFYQDALVYLHLTSRALTLQSDESSPYVILRYANFPHMGFWAAKDAPFLCLEPWNGHSDYEDATGELKDKEDILCLEPKATNHFSMEIEVVDA